MPRLRASRASRSSGPVAAWRFFVNNFQQDRPRLPADLSALCVSIFGLQGSLKWVDNFGIQILIYVMLGWGLNIVVGLAGLLDLGYVAFYAVGAYSYALLSAAFRLLLLDPAPLAGILAAFWGVILGFPGAAPEGDYLAIVTLAFGEIIRLG